MNPQKFLQLDRVIHEKGRLGIMSLLAACGAPAATATQPPAPQATIMVIG